MEEQKKRQMRRQKRVEFSTQVEYKYENLPHKFQGRASDLTPEGMFIETASPAASGTILTVKFQLRADDDPIVSKSEVRHCKRGAGMGIKFLALDSTHQEKIAKFHAGLVATPSNNKENLKAVTEQVIRDLLKAEGDSVQQSKQVHLKDLTDSIQKCRGILAVLLAAFNNLEYRFEQPRLEILATQLQQALKLLLKGSFSSDAQPSEAPRQKIDLLIRLDHLYCALKELENLLAKKGNLTAKISELFTLSDDFWKVLEHMVRADVSSNQGNESSQPGNKADSASNRSTGETQNATDQVSAVPADNRVEKPALEDQKSSVIEGAFGLKPKTEENLSTREPKKTEVYTMIPFDSVAKIESTLKEVDEKIRFLRKELGSIVDIEVSDYEAFLCWQSIGQHRADLAQKLNREVSLCVAAVDYFTYVDKTLKKLFTNNDVQQVVGR